MSVSAKDLRYKTKQIVRGILRGEKPIITYRGHPIAQIHPLKTSKKTATFSPIGYGMWSDHKGIQEVNEWLEKQRSPRYSR